MLLCLFFIFVGVFILNVACRDSTLKQKVVSSLKEHFGTLCSYKLQEEVNEVFLCIRTNNKQTEEIKCCVEAAVTKVNAISKRRKLQDNDLVNTAEFMKNLKFT